MPSATPKQLATAMVKMGPKTQPRVCETLELASLQEERHRGDGERRTKAYFGGDRRLEDDQPTRGRRNAPAGAACYACECLNRDDVQAAFPIDARAHDGQKNNACLDFELRPEAAASMRREKSRSRNEDEPLPQGEGWVECGGQRMWAMGFTAAGFPYGVDEHELRAAGERDSAEAGWALAKRILRAVATLRGGRGAKVDVGYVKKIGQGLSRDIFAAQVEVASSSGADITEMAVLLPTRGCDAHIDERTEKEARLLVDLAQLDLPFRVPRAFAVCRVDHLVLVRSYERGVELDSRAGRQGRVRPWETVARLAAAIHAAKPAQIPSLPPRFATRQDHARAAIAALDGLEEPELVDARAWMQDHLPPASPSVLVHGDLLGQNILLGLDDADAVIDWEYAQFGDPAYDLAIVTRGARRPFHIEGGMDKLLDAYTLAGGSEIQPAHVHLHELALAARWYRDALVRKSIHGPAQQLQFLRGVLRRASACKT
jgi:aminoglycoside phosphotransferase (APT) family kinase protein